MARLIVPTRNRTTSLAGLLAFLEQFYPGTQLIIADGSTADYKPANTELVRSFPSLEIDYRQYPEELPLFDRVLAVLENESDEFFVMGADDDFPMMNTLNNGEAFLRKNSDFVTALGAVVLLTLQSAETMEAQLLVTRSIVSENAHTRAIAFSLWNFPTTYAVTRRDLLIERYRWARENFLVGFFDFSVGVHDCLTGKIHALTDLSYVLTRNYKHSYLRPEAGVVFLRRSEDVMRLISGFKERIITKAGLEEAVAQRISERLIKDRVAELCGRQVHHHRDFEDSRVFREATAQGQIDLFKGLFTLENPVRLNYQDRLQFISDMTLRAATSDDNRDEKKNIETLEHQLEAEKERTSAPSAQARTDGG